MRSLVVTRLLAVWVGCLLVAGSFAAVGSADRGAALLTQGGTAGTEHAAPALRPAVTTTSERPAPASESSSPAAPPGSTPTGPATPAATSPATDAPGSHAGPSPAAPGASRPVAATTTTAPARPPAFDDRTVRIPVPHGAAVDARVYCCASMHGTDLATWADPWIPPGQEGYWHSEARFHELAALRTVGGTQSVSLVRLGHVPTATASLVETWAAAGSLRSKVSSTPYVPRRVLRSGEGDWVKHSGGEVWVTVRGAQLEVADHGFEQVSAPSATPWVMYLDDAQKVRRYVTVHRNRVGELYTTERSEPYLPAVPPPVGAPTRYDDHGGFGHVVVVRTSATAITVTESQARADGTYGPVPPQFQAALGGPCLVMWHSFQRGHTRCFSVVTDGSRITAMGFHDVGAPVPRVR